ncbi:hypothetical protein CHELA20_54019 [Hyphomicrobiales bacterium]|nr:hypothetical protein CHELA41_20906 [Hyphomicrobiales bacterium]CAH1685426.1 hypothetical protein CHELA20_54019 [Hyphomicrobiales bacterium]
MLDRDLAEVAVFRKNSDLLRLDRFHKERIERLCVLRRRRIHPENLVVSGFRDVRMLRHRSHENGVLALDNRNGRQRHAAGDLAGDHLHLVLGEQALDRGDTLGRREVGVVGHELDLAAAKDAAVLVEHLDRELRSLDILLADEGLDRIDQAELDRIGCVRLAGYGKDGTEGERGQVALKNYHDIPPYMRGTQSNFRACVKRLL